MGRSRNGWGDDRRGYWETMFPKAISVRGGIRAQNKRGAFGQSWWASRWEAYLLENIDDGRLSRGRTYARKGQVTNLDIANAEVTAKVQGSDPRPYKISIRLKPLTEQQQQRLMRHLTQDAGTMAAILAGEMPRAVEEAFGLMGAHLFPESDKDITTSCSCFDGANPCKHIAAVYSLVVEALNQDPLLLLQLHGLDRAALQGVARPTAASTLAAKPAAKSVSKPAAPPAPIEQPKRRGRPPKIALPPPALLSPAPQPAPKPIAPVLPRDLAAFWGIAKRAHVLGQAHEPPTAHNLSANQGTEMLERIGKLPFWRAQTPFQEAMATFYGAAHAHAQLLLTQLAGEQR